MQVRPGRQRVARDPADVALRHRDRGRPHRGDRAHVRVRPHSGNGAAGAAADSRGHRDAHARRCGGRHARAARLLRGDHLQLHRAGLQELFAPGAPSLTLSNPISAELATMRASLWPGLAAALASNQRRQQPRVRLFEVGRKFVDRGRATARCMKCRSSRASPRAPRCPSSGARRRQPSISSTCGPTSKPCCVRRALATSSGSCRVAPRIASRPDGRDSPR